MVHLSYVPENIELSIFFSILKGGDESILSSSEYIPPVDLLCPNVRLNCFGVAKLRSHSMLPSLDEFGVRMGLWSSNAVEFYIYTPNVVNCCYIGTGRTVGT